MTKLRSAFFGTSDFAVPSLRAFSSATDCVLVVTQPDRPAGRGHRLQPTPVKVAARELGIPVIEPERLRAVAGDLAALELDLFAVASYGKIVPQMILDLPRLLALNVHPSLLPLYRGATPLQAQLRDGVTTGGVTIIAMDSGMDTGDLVLQEQSAIAPDETYGELHDRFAAVGARMLGEACDLASRGDVRRRPQAGLRPEADIERTATRPLRKDDLLLDWSLTSKGVVDFVRSLAPAPLARAHIVEPNTKLVRVRALSPGDPELRALGATPGSAAFRYAGKPAVVVRTGDGAVSVEILVPPNRRQTDAAAFAQSLVASSP